MCTSTVCPLLAHTQRKFLAARDPASQVVAREVQSIKALAVTGKQQLLILLSPVLKVQIKHEHVQLGSHSTHFQDMMLRNYNQASKKDFSESWYS